MNGKNTPPARGGSIRRVWHRPKAATFEVIGEAPSAQGRGTYLLLRSADRSVLFVARESDTRPAPSARTAAQARQQGNTAAAAWGAGIERSQGGEG